MYGQVSPLEYSPITPPSLTYKSWKQKRLLNSKVNPSTIEQINGRNNQICLRPARRTFKKPHPATRTSNSLIRQRELSKSLIRQRELSGSSSGNENFQKSLSGNENFQRPSSGNENSQEKHHPATNFSKRIIEQRELFRNHRSEKKKLTKYRKGETPPPTSPLHSPLSI